MKKWTAIAALFIFICFPILFFSEQDAVLGEMRASVKGDYSIYLFWTSGGHVQSDLAKESWSSLIQEAAFQEGAKIQFTAIDLSDRRYFFQYRSVLEHSERPVYMLLNHAGIVLQTPKLEKVRDYLQNAEVEGAAFR
ncbi:hypothetical protein ACX93W_20240 [Paenibacillus sp. CAU 1782]